MVLLLDCLCRSGIWRSLEEEEEEEEKRIKHFSYEEGR
jgi:hypothetical protein